LSHRADTGDEHAAQQLDDLLAERGDEVALSHRADTGDVYAETRVAALLTLEDETLGPVR
jgi:hypothetical protein